MKWFKDNLILINIKNRTMSKFMNKLENKLVSEGLSQNTAEQYVKRLMRTNQNKQFTSLVFLRRVDDVMNFLKDNFSASSIESYVAMFVSILSKMPSKTNDVARKKYENILTQPNKYFEKRDRSVKTENQKKGWIEKEDFDKYINEAKEKALTSSRKTKNFTTADYDNILNYFIVSLYTLLPPRRNKDFQTMKINSAEGNSLDTKTMTMTFRDYKTSTTYGEQKLDLGDYPEFMKILKMYLKRRNNESEYLLVRHNGKHFVLNNDITRKLNKIFGGNKVSSTAIRSMYLTEKYGEKNKEMKSDAENMGHSIAQQQTAYIKK